MKKSFRILLLITAAISLAACANTTDNEAYDVVIIGAGGAGMAAAIEAYDEGANVIILEKMPVAGGNTIRATAGMNASETIFQQDLGIEDDNDIFYDDTFAGGYEKNDPDLLRYFVENSASAIQWLDSLGIELSNITTTGGMSVNRTHRPADGSAIGGYLVSGLLEQIEARNIPILYMAQVVELIVDNDNNVTGVSVEVTENQETQTKQIDAKAVIMATGGFAYNAELYTQYNENLTGFVTTNHAGAMGDGIVMIEAIGGALVDMAEIQIHPTVEQETAEMITEAVRGGGAILVNQAGERFFNEMETRDKVSAAIIALPEQYAWIVFDQRIRENNSAIEKYITKNIVTEGSTIADLASKIEVSEVVLETTVASWNDAVATNDDALGRTTGMPNPLDSAPYYAIKIAPGVHHTMGGVKINTNTEVLREDGSVIKGLYAAGEVAGGIHGGNRIGGNAVADIIIFGRQAGLQAGAFALANGGSGHAVIEGDDPSNEQPAIKDGIAAQFKDGEYTATATGNNGVITVVATVENGYITTIETPANPETESLFARVEELVINKIIYEQTTESVDIVTSATVSSQAILEALDDIIGQAKD